MQILAARFCVIFLSASISVAQFAFIRIHFAYLVSHFASIVALSPLLPCFSMSFVPSLAFTPPHFTHPRSVLRKNRTLLPPSRVAFPASLRTFTTWTTSFAPCDTKWKSFGSCPTMWSKPKSHKYSHPTSHSIPSILFAHPTLSFDNPTFCPLPSLCNTSLDR